MPILKNADESQIIVQDRHSGDNPQLALGTVQAAHALSISTRTLWNWTFPRGRIHAKRVGKRVLYPVSELQRFLADCDDVSTDAGDTIQ